MAIHFMSSTLISDWLISHCIFQFLSKTDISMHPNGQWIIHSPGGRDEDEINDRVNWSIYHFTPGLSLLCSTQLNCQFLQTQHWYFLFVWKLSTINPDRLAVTTQQTAGSGMSDTWQDTKGRIWVLHFTISRHYTIPLWLNFCLLLGIMPPRYLLLFLNGNSSTRAPTTDVICSQHFQVALHDVLLFDRQMTQII